MRQTLLFYNFNSIFMKKIYLFAALAAMLAACSENDLSKETADLQQNAEKGSVMFDAYTQRGVTRAGQTGVMTNEKLKAAVNLTDQNGGGFGVFGYYTDNNDYEQSRMPDFMYNQLVEWKDGYWQYSPIKYWPNEYGSNAISDDADKVTFFAYAPYVATNPSGKIERTTGDDLSSYGITGLSRNSNQGDPIVKYIASFERSKSVDLLWGIVGAAEANGWSLTNGGTEVFPEGYPWLNVMRPAEAATQATATQRVKFTFAHALTQLTMNIDAIVDEINKGSNTLATGTKIYVRQLSMTGVALKGALNLNNTEAGKRKALWLDFNGLADIESGVPVVLYDGRKDGKEGVAGATASNEKVLGFNPDIISNDGNTTEGVTATAKKVFADDPVMLIPTGENMELEIIYDVETTDAMLPTLLSDGKNTGSSIENKVRKTIDFPQNGILYGLENGKHYTINLHLGMNSVKFDVAGIDEWVEGPNQPDVDLPSNGSSSVGGVANAASAPLSNFAPFTGLAYNETTYSFTVTGLTPGETIAKAVVSTAVIDALNDGTNKATVTVGSTVGGTDDKADASGTAYVKVTMPNNQANSTVHKLEPTDNYILIEGVTSKKGWKARFEQAAHPFGLQVASVANNSTKDEIVLGTTYATGLNENAFKLGVGKTYGTAADHEADFVKVSINGTPLSYKATPGANEYNYSGSDKKITIGQNLAVGDKVTITVAASKIDGSDVVEDGAKETVEFTVGGIYYAPGFVQSMIARTATYAVKAPEKVGEPGTPTYALNTTSVTGSEMTVAGTAITALKELAVTDGVDATISTLPTMSAGDPYFYTITSCKATYKVKIDKQSTTLAWTITTPVVTNIGVGSSGVEIDFGGTVELTGVEDGTISSPAPAVTYDVTKVVLDGEVKETPTSFFTFEGSTLKSVASALVAAKNYEVTITATYAGNDKYNGSTATETISVQTVGY
jgi:hypothetical protein